MVEILFDSFEKVAFKLKVSGVIYKKNYCFSVESEPHFYTLEQYIFAAKNMTISTIITQRVACLLVQKKAKIWHLLRKVTLHSNNVENWSCFSCAYSTIKLVQKKEWEIHKLKTFHSKQMIQFFLSLQL